jgi:hypothetical protein
MAPSVVLPSTTCHAPTPHRAADIKTTNMATARRIAIQYAADQRTAERFAAACSPRLPNGRAAALFPYRRLRGSVPTSLRMEGGGERLAAAFLTREE